jgi:hypothetical protein
MPSNSTNSFTDAEKALVGDLPAISDIVADLTPQLGGPLDAQGYSVTDVGALTEAVNTVGASGATEALDTSLYGVHEITMDQNCTFTFTNPPTSGISGSFVLYLDGAFTPTFPGTVTWETGEPTYATPLTYVFQTLDAGTTWSGNGIVSSPKNNLSAIIAPAVGNDGTEGYSIGSRWIDTVLSTEYICFDITTGAAVWTDITGAGGDVATSGEVDTGTDNVKSISPLALAGSALQTKVDGIEALATADQSAAEVVVTPAGNLASVEVQAALTELQGDIDALVSGAAFQGTWNASTNTPTLVSSTGTAGHFYTVSVTGTTSLDGITTWGVGDSVWFGGGVWNEVNNVSDHGTFSGLADDDHPQYELKTAINQDGMVLDGTTLNGATCPDSVGVSIAGDIDIRAKINFADYTPATTETIAAKWEATGDQREWRWSVTATTMQLSISTAGTDTVSFASTVSLGSVETDGTTIEVRVTLDVNDGGATPGSVCTFYTRNDGGTWVQLGATVAGAVVAIFDSTALVTVGAHSNTVATEVANGRIMSVELYSGIAGTLAASPRFDHPSVLQQPFDDAQANTWTITGSAVTWGNGTTALKSVPSYVPVDTVTALGNLGATETLDFANPKQTGTLDANCTFSFTGATAALNTIVLTLTEDGTGSWTITTPTVANTPGAINATALKATLITIYYDGADYWWLTSATET